MMRFSLIQLLILLIIIYLIYLLYSYVSKFTPQIYYINLDKATDRKKRFIKNNESHFKLNRIKAISPNDNFYKNVNIIKPLHCNNTDLEICCSLSHLKALHKAYHDNTDFALIMEDDMYFLKYPNWKDLINSAPSDWDILQLYTINTTIYKTKNINWIVHNLGDHFSSCGAYLVNKKSLEKILNKFIPNYKNPDWNAIKTINLTKSNALCLADYLLYQNVKTYVHTNILLNTEGWDSYIHPEHLPLHRQSINVIKELNNK